MALPKLVQMTNTVVEHAGKAKREMASITGVINDVATASAADWLLIQEDPDQCYHCQQAVVREPLAKTTGIVLDWKAGSTADRKAIRALLEDQVSQR